MWSPLTQAARELSGGAAVKRGFRLDLQGLRGVALLISLVYHATDVLPGGFVSFDIFFVLSGFVITGMLLREADGSGTISLRRFYSRRFRRLAPPLAAMLIATVIASALILAPGQPYDVVVTSAMGAVFLYANFAVPRVSGDYFGPAAEENPLLHTWSLSLEEQVYLTFPLLLLLGLLLRRRVGSASFLVLGVPILVASLASLMYADLSAMGGRVLGVVPGSLGGYYGPASRFWEFGLGAILAVAIHRTAGASLRTSRLPALLGWAGLVGLLGSVAVFRPSLGYPAYITLWPALCICAIIWAGARSTTGPQRLLTARPLVAIGTISYSWYLWHWPFISLARAANADQATVIVVTMLSAVPAFASYAYLERPAVLFPYRRLTVRAFTAAVGAPLVAVSLLVVGGAVHWGSAEVEKFSAAAELRPGQRDGCYGTTEGCVYGPDEARRVYVLGDSTADQWTEGLTLASEPLGLGVTSLTRTNCPPILEPYVRREVRRFASPEEEADKCVDYNMNALTRLESEEPGVVFLAFGALFLDSDRGEFETSPLRALDSGLRETIGRLQASGHSVVLAHTLPGFLVDSGWGAESCSTVSMVVGRCTAQTSRSDAETEAAVSRDLVSRLAAELDVVVWDPFEALCDDDVCGTEREGVVLYRDDAHVSGALSRASAPRLRSALVLAEGRLDR